MLTQLSDSLSKLQLPLRLAISNGPSLDLSPNPAVTLEILDPRLLAELSHPSLDILGEAYVDRRLDIQGPIMTVMEIADKLSLGTFKGDPGITLERTAHDKALDAEQEVGLCEDGARRRCNEMQVTLCKLKQII